MKQNEKNSKKAQELTNEELEQVNGGDVSIQDILQSTTAILMFP
jgi:bacteriocin-like protein